MRTLIVIALLALAVPARADDAAPVRVSGRYPHLAMFNRQGECGTGAVVPWADRLWVITYAPHLPQGSDDKLYEIDAGLKLVARPESVGGTPADRMIHRESNQLIIGPYFIDDKRNVRVIPPKQMPGRLTAAARHLTDPADKVYLFDMEGTLYETDVRTLAFTKLFHRAAPGAHGKGGYTGQGRLVVANNGNAIANKAKPALDDAEYAKDPEAAGALAEWDGKAWRMVERRQFTDVTGPGGIYGAADDASPVWAVGWDKRSVILKVLDAGQWHTFRLPTADYSYVAKHGWYTEWPRIREVTGGKLLLNMHGGWFEFPKTFSAANAGGLHPLGDYLKITGDFAPWTVDGKEQIVFGCDDSSVMQNPRAGQSQSNLWFATWDDLTKCGRPAGFGGPWVGDSVMAGQPSVPYLFGGYTGRVLHLSHKSDQPVTFTIETDADGKGQWKPAGELVTVPAAGYTYRVFPDDLPGQWVRVTADRDCKCSAYFHYGPSGGAATDREMFASLADSGDNAAWTGGSLWPLGDDIGTLVYEFQTVGPDGKPSQPRMVEFTPDLKARPYAGKLPEPDPKLDGAKDYAVKVEEGSVLVTEGKGRFRLPLSGATAEDLSAAGPGLPRVIREGVTERFLLNAGGSFYVLPRPTAGGASRIKPICTHDKRITDWCSWRGLLVLAGTKPDAKPDGHYFATTEYGGVGLWFGDVDDLWKLGKPRGRGGPWVKADVKPGQPSDPYLMAGYDRKTVELSHDAAGVVQITLEVDTAADGAWHPFRTFEVQPGRTAKFEFPAGYSAQWVRAKCDTACRATVQFTYE